MPEIPEVIKPNHDGLYDRVTKVCVFLMILIILGVIGIAVNKLMNEYSFSNLNARIISQEQTTSKIEPTCRTQQRGTENEMGIGVQEFCNVIEGTCNGSRIYSCSYEELGNICTIDYGTGNGIPKCVPRIQPKE